MLRDNLVGLIEPMFSSAEPEQLTVDKIGFAVELITNLIV
jgi:hypothetical protein